MQETHLYQRIAESIRRDILSGTLKPGDPLPSVREMTRRWDCTLGTVQRAYTELARQGLVASRPGQGSRVVGFGNPREEAALRRAGLVHRAETFLLEVLTAGHPIDEVEGAVRMALDRWRAVEREPHPNSGPGLRFCGSHDPAVAWLAGHFAEVAGSGMRMDLTFTGSLGGLIALAEGDADLAGCHLWDADTGLYNGPFVRRLLPGRRTALVTLAERRLGLIVRTGNPDGIRSLADLERTGLRFANRQPGSGTRVWLDEHLRQAGVAPAAVVGYTDEKLTHTAVAQAVGAGEAEVGLGLESAALASRLDFVPLALERYDLVIPAERMGDAQLQRVVEWLQGQAARAAFDAIGGYETALSGKVEWVE